jgi:hypothetical protein
MSKNESKENLVCKTYEDFLKAGKDVIEAVKLPFQIKAAKNKLAGEIIALESNIAEAELEIVKAKSEHPFELSTILSKINSKELIERKLKQAIQLSKELFPEV